MFYRDSVQFQRLYVKVTGILIFCPDLQYVIRIASQVEAYFFKQGTAKLEGGLSGCMTLYVKKPQSSHYIPGTQLPLVFILTIAISMQGPGTIKLIANGPGPLLRQPGFS
jgi:hypothetical protein